MPWLLDKLAEHYKSAQITFPSLKAVTLAQWILESGHAKSALAVEHRNFAGLKWRNEMVGWATPIEYGANDGVDIYCKFVGIDAFIAGYWHFLSRSPYQGWEEQAAISPEAFITFIGHKFNPSHPEYVERVLSLLPEAETLLEKG